MNSERCKQCRFYEPLPRSTHSVMEAPGICRRYPPVMLAWPKVDDPDDIDPLVTWPEVLEYDWCGEFKAKDAE